MNKLSLVADGDADIVAARRFDAPPEAVFRAHTEPALIQEWMLGPPDWTMPVCVMEPTPGGRIHYEWEKQDGHRFGITGEVHEIDPGARIVHTERMQLDGKTVEYRVETRFEADGEGTLLTMRLMMPDAATRQVMLDTGMEHGMEASYARIDPLFSGAAIHLGPSGRASRGRDGGTP